MIKAMLDSGGMVINWSGGGNTLTTRAGGQQAESLDLVEQIQAMQQLLLPAVPETRAGLGAGAPDPNMPLNKDAVIAEVTARWKDFSAQVEPRLYVKDKGTHAPDLPKDWDHDGEKYVYDKFRLDKDDKGDSILMVENNVWGWKYTHPNGTWKMKADHANSKNPAEGDVVLAIDRYWPMKDGDPDAVWPHSTAVTDIEKLYQDRQKWLGEGATREKGYKILYQEVDKLRFAYSTFVSLYDYPLNSPAGQLLKEIESFVKDNFGVNDINTGVYDNKPLEVVYAPPGESPMSKNDSAIYINTYGKLIYDGPQAVMLERNILAAQQVKAPLGGDLLDRNAPYTSSVSPRGKLFDFYFGNVTAAPEFDHSNPEGSFPGNDDVQRTFSIYYIDDFGGSTPIGTCSGTGGCVIDENIKTKEIKKYRVEETTPSDAGQIDDWMEWRWELRPGNSTCLILDDANTMGPDCEVRGRDEGVVELVATGMGTHGVVYEIPIKMHVEVPSKFYVSNRYYDAYENGYDVNNACRSVGDALVVIEDLKSFMTRWPTGKSATIIIEDVIRDNTTDVLVDISKEDAYPPIILRSYLAATDNWLGAEQGVLWQRERAGAGTVVLLVGGGNTVTLGDGLLLMGGVDTISRGSTGASRSGGVVVTGLRSSLIIDGAEISGNIGYKGGGVFVGAGATCTMKKGTITGNSGFMGGGVYVDRNATFNLGTLESSKTDAGRSVGIIKYNVAISGDVTGKARGGGVYTDGVFNMYDGGIVNNTTDSPGQGGGVFISTFATFTKGEYGWFPNYQTDGGVQQNTADEGDTFYDARKSPPATEANFGVGDRYGL